MPVPKRRFLMVALGLAAIFAFLLPSLRPRPAPRYTVIDLGVLPGDATSWATGINNRVEIVGFSNSEIYEERGFLYAHGRMTKLGQAVTYGGPPFINNSGQINQIQRISSPASVSGYERSLPHHALLQSAAGTVNISTPPGCTMAVLHGNNRWGQVVGTARRQTAPQSRFREQPFVYDSRTRKFSLLPIPPGGWEGFAEGINDQGQVAGIAWQPSVERAMLWNFGKPVLLTGLPKMNDSRGEAINNQGDVVGSAWSDPSAAAQYVNDHPLRWRLLAPIFERQWKSRAVIYKSGRAQDLNTLIPEDTDWILEQANGINDRGQIVGYGRHHGQQRAFLLTPVR